MECVSNRERQLHLTLPFPYQNLISLDWTSKKNERLCRRKSDDFFWFFFLFYFLSSIWTPCTRPSPLSFVKSLCFCSHFDQVLEPASILQLQRPTVQSSTLIFLHPSPWPLKHVLGYLKPLSSFWHRPETAEGAPDCAQQEGYGGGVKQSVSAVVLVLMFAVYASKASPCSFFSCQFWRCPMVWPCSLFRQSFHF